MQLKRIMKVALLGILLSIVFAAQAFGQCGSDPKPEPSIVNGSLFTAFDAVQVEASADATEVGLAWYDSFDSDAFFAKRLVCEGSSGGTSVWEFMFTDVSTKDLAGHLTVLVTEDNFTTGKDFPATFHRAVIPKLSIKRKGRQTIARYRYTARRPVSIRLKFRRLHGGKTRQMKRMVQPGKGVVTAKLPFQHGTYKLKSTALVPSTFGVRKDFTASLGKVKKL